MVRIAKESMEQVASQVEMLELPQAGSAVERGNLFRESLIQRIGSERLDLWFGHATRWQFDHNGVEITLENAFLVDCVRNFCWDELKSVAADLGLPNAPIRLLHDSPIRVAAPLKSGPTLPSNINVMKPSRIDPPSELPRVKSPVVSMAGESDVRTNVKAPESDWWKEFVKGSSSRLATTALEMVLERPGR